MRRALRVAWAVLTAVVVEAALLGLAVFPAGLLLAWGGGGARGYTRIAVLALLVGPAYLTFAVSFMLLSALAMRALGWRTPPAARLRIADLSWPLLTWARYLVSAHLVRLVAGALLRATPLWSVYLRLNGARVGRRVFVNSLHVTDHNLLELGDGVVIGAAAHVSGHTVEAGFVKTGTVRLGRDVTVGVGSVIGIDVVIGAGAQVGALSFVPKHRRLAAGTTYVGIPARRVDSRRAARISA